MVGLWRRRAPVDTPKKYQPLWDLIIEPFVEGMPVKQMLGLDKEYARELRIVSGHLHQLLLGTPGLTSLAWFFVGWRHKDHRCRVASRNFVTECLISDVTGFQSPSDLVVNRKAVGEPDAGGGRSRRRKFAMLKQL
jgi:hypothetical protein